MPMNSEKLLSTCKVNTVFLVVCGVCGVMTHSPFVMSYSAGRENVKT